MIELYWQNEAPELSPGHYLLGDCKQRVEVPLLYHQFIERAGFGNASVFEGQYTVISLQQVFIQSVGDYNASQVVQIQDRIGNLESSLGINSSPCRSP